MAKAGKKRSTAPAQHSVSEARILELVADFVHRREHPEPSAQQAALLARLKAARANKPPSLLARLKAANANKPPHDLSHLYDLDALSKRLEERGRLDFEEFCRNHPELADDDKPEPVPAPLANDDKIIRNKVGRPPGGDKDKLARQGLRKEFAELYALHGFVPRADVSTKAATVRLNRAKKNGDPDFSLSTVARALDRKPKGRKKR